jgi:hypothetical protein
LGIQRQFLKIGLLGLLALVALPTSGRAERGAPEFDFSWGRVAGESPISGLDEESVQLSYEPDVRGGRFRDQVRVRGVLLERDGILSLGLESVPVDPQNGAFEIRLPLFNGSAAAQLTLQTPSGRLESSELRVALLPAGTHAARAVFRGKRFFPRSAVGLTWVNYSETTRADYTAMALSGRLDLSYLLLPPRWEVSVSSFGTLAWLNQSTDDRIRFLGVNGRVGYHLLVADPRWKLSLYAGGYYTTTWVRDGSFGFQNMMGPQAFPNVRYTLAPGKTVSSYVKYSPVVGGGARLLPGSNFEVATGLSYSREFASGRSFGVSFDWARIQLQFTRVRILSQTATLGLAVGL